MAKKNNAPPPEDSEQKELEEKIKKMLDPREPDPKKGTKNEEVDATDDESLADLLPTKIEITDNAPNEKTGNKEIDEDPKGAPEVSGKKIAVAHDEEEVEVNVGDSKAVASQDDDEEVPSISNALESDPEEAQQDEVVDETPGEKTEDLERIAPSEDIKEPAKDAALDEAVDDIAKEESDKLLEEDDKSVAAKVQNSEKKQPLKARIKAFFAAWWRNKPARYMTIFIVLLALATAAIIPSSRYYVLNMAGVRSSASIQIIDQSTLQPLKNVKIEINGVTTQTDIDGLATLQEVKLGATKLIIEKRAFRGVEKNITVGWGSNPLPSEQLTPVGTQYVFKVKDFVNGQSVSGVEAVHEDASALSNEEGEIKLTLDKPADSFDVELISEGYKTEIISVDADDEAAIERLLVPAKKHVFMSRRAGTYDVFAAYVDGSEETLLLKGTGEEREDIALVPHTERDVVALVSTRSGQRNEDGFQLSSLTVLDINNPKITKEVVQSERIQIIGWHNERLIYVQIKSGTSAANPDRHQLKTYNIEQDVAAELASANYFNDIMLLKDRILYAPSSAYAKVAPGLFSVNPNGSDKKTIHGSEVWSMFRTSYDQLTFTTGKDWFSLHINDGGVEQLEGQPNEFVSRVYIDNAPQTKSARIERRDGKGTLLIHDLAANNEDVLFERGGLQLPVTWLNQTTLTFRIKTDTETADYVISTNGGEPKKIADVTDADGLDRWYYY
jgi:hypothetical protein